jgi:hypothetical protein
VAEEEQLVIHPPDGAQKRELLCLLGERFEAGAALLYAEPVEARSAAGRRHMARAWGEEVRRRSIGFVGAERVYDVSVDESWNWCEYPDPADKF